MTNSSDQNLAEELLRYNHELLKLARDQEIDEGNINLALQVITEALTNALEVERASIWLYNKDQSAIVCQDLYIKSLKEHSSGHILKAKDFPSYFKYLSEERTLPAHDCSTDPATVEFNEVYTKPLNIISMLDAPVRMKGKMIGVVCTESVGIKRTWSMQEEAFAGNVTDIIARAMMAHERKKVSEDLAAMNSLLEARIEERTIELEEQRARSVFSSKMASLGEMASGIAHEINNPLSIIYGFSQMLLGMAQDSKTLSEEELKAPLNKIMETTLRIDKIIKGLKFFARDSGKDSMENVSVNQIIEDTLSLCREKFKMNCCELKVSIEPLDLELECQSVGLSQVLLNLLNNSFDAISEFEEKWIEVSCLQKGNFVEFRVTDSGHGIPQELHEKIMQPFFTTKPVGKGTGLGLSITRGILDHHNGSFAIDATHPNTSFVISIPAKVAAP